MKINIEIEHGQKAPLVSINGEEIKGIVAINYLWQTLTDQNPTIVAMVIKYLEKENNENVEKIVYL